MNKWIIFIIIPTLVFIAGCGQEAGETHGMNHQAENHQHAGEESGHTRGHEHEPGAEAIRISPEKQKEWKIDTSVVELQDLRAQIQLPGVVVLNQNRTADISSYVEGKVTQVKTDLGSRVHAGTALAVINSPEFAQAQAAFLEARSAYLLSRQEYERAKMLLYEKAIGEKEFQRREAAFQQASTKYGALGSALHSYGIDHAYIEKLISKCEAMESQPYKCEVADPFLSIASPLSGTVVFRDVVIGEHIKPEKTLFRVTDMNRLWVQLDAYEKDLPYLHLDEDVKIQTTVYGEDTFSGQITYISDVIDEQIRTITVRVEVRNPELKLKPNMCVQGRIRSPVAEKQLAVPEAAVQSLEGSKIVFVQTAPDVFNIRRVDIKDGINGWTAIRAGIQPGERIVHEGAFTLKSELTKGTIGHAHAH
jgi:membrane fusion protein, heavy metal efflux system